MKFLINRFCYYLWCLSEWSGIRLGRLAPYIFNGMIGCKKMKRIK